MFGFTAVDFSVNLHQRAALWVRVSDSAQETGVGKPSYSLLDELQHHVVLYISCEDL